MNATGGDVLIIISLIENIIWKTKWLLVCSQIILIKKYIDEHFNLTNWNKKLSNYRAHIRSSHLQTFFTICFHWKTPMLESLFNKIAGLQACNFIKKTPTQVLSSEIYKILKNTLFYKTSPMAASNLYWF